MTDEDIKGETQFGISDDQGDMIFGYITDQITPCTDNNNDNNCGEEDYYNAFSYAGEFDSERVFEYQLNAFDVLGNAGISNYSLTYSYLLPGNFRSIESPMKTAKLIIFDYTLSQPASLIISESNLEQNDIGMNSLSNQVNIFGQNINFDNPANIRFSSTKYEQLDEIHLKICKKNQHGNWEVIESNVYGDFIQAEIDSIGSYALFYIDDFDTSIPHKFDLIGCFPNPFNPEVNIQLSIPYTTNINLNIFDIAGRKVRSLANEVVDSGIIEIPWNGVGDDGTMLSSGVYFVVLDMNNSTFINKVTLLK